MPNGEEAFRNMAEKNKFSADEILGFSDEQIKQFNKDEYNDATIKIECDSESYKEKYETYKKKFFNLDDPENEDKWKESGTYCKRLSGKSYELIRKRDSISDSWSACKFLSFLLYIGKTEANIPFDDISNSHLFKYTKIRRNEAGKIESREKTKKEIVIFALGPSNTNRHFLWNEENVSYAIATSDGTKERSNCIKMIKLIHQRNKEIFAGFTFVIKPDSNKGKQAMNEKNKQDNSNLKDIVKIVQEAIPKNKQVIFTGAPGTGKTYTVREVVKKLTDKDESRYKFVQFHPSYDYSDFVEGLRPVVTKDSPDPTFVRLDGTFKQFCRSIVEKELETFCSGFRDLSAPEKREKLKEYYDNAVKKGTSQGEETVYYFLIDEINRADLSKVFGELMFGLEESYRGIENRFDTQYKNLKTYQVDPDTGIASPMAFDCFADGFFIPHNLHLIGTMNDIDRSVESFDFALRRRFRWIDVKANKIMESSLKAMGVPDPEDIARRASKMNNCLSGFSFGLGEAYHIGPAYFKSMSAGEKLKEDLKEVFSHRIEPLLREYTRGQNAGKVEELIQKCEEKLLENKTQGGE